MPDKKLTNPTTTIMMQKTQTGTHDLSIPKAYYHFRLSASADLWYSRCMKNTRPWASALLMFFALPLFPEDSGAWFKWSLITMAASRGTDIGTSLTAGRHATCRETNPLYGPRYGARGALVEGGLFTAAPILAEWLIARRHPGARKYFAVLNFSASAQPAISAARNGKCF